MPEFNPDTKLSKKTAKNHKKLSKQSFTPQITPMQIIVKKPNASLPLKFPTVSYELNKIANDIVDAKLKKRNTLLLAKIAKDSLFKPSETSDQKGSTHDSNKYQSFQQPLLSKSIHQINDFYCGQLSKELIHSLTYFLKERKISAKVMVNVMIVTKPKMGFNIGGLCFWDNSVDGTINIKKKLGVVGCKVPQVRQQSNFSQSQMSCDSDSSINTQQGLLIVAIYFCKYQQNFKSKFGTATSSQ